MRMRACTIVAGLLLAASGVRAQQPQPGTTAPAPAPASARAAEPLVPGVDQPNIQFDITIADDGGGGNLNQAIVIEAGMSPVKKSLTLMVQANGSGSLRSSGVGRLAPTNPNQAGDRLSVDLNADVKLAPHSPREPNKIRARIALDYQPFSPEWKAAPGRVRAQVDVMLENGKKTVLWQTTDPVLGLRTRIEVTATVLK